MKGFEIRPYILAGGRSSRMGRDKAMMPLAGRTLLGRAVDTLRAVPGLADSGGRVTVTLVGVRTELEGADRVIADGYPGCGPLGGMEAALRDLSGGPSHVQNAEWAFFLPVDMPFLPAELIGSLLREWSNAGDRGAKACYVLIDGRAQPLISLLHRTLHPPLLEALTTGYYKVTPVLQSATDVLASSCTESLVFSHPKLYTTDIDSKVFGSPIATENALAEQEQLKHFWFSNLNSEEDFLRAQVLAPTRKPS